MSGVPLDWTPLFAHVAGVPVEEVLPGVLACGAVGIRIGTVWMRERLPRGGGRPNRRSRGQDRPGEGKPR